MSLRRALTPSVRWCLAVAAVAAAAFAPTLRFGFVNWDDPDLILENPRVTSGSLVELLDLHGGAYLPVRDLAWNLAYRAAGPNATAFHLLNVAAHAVASGLFCLLVIRLLGRGKAVVGGMAGLVFAVHPLHVEPVAWASGLKDPLAAALMFAAFLLALRALRVEGARRRLLGVGGALVLFWCAVLAKASVVVLPVLLCLYALALARGRGRALKLTVPFVVLAALTAWLALSVGETSGAVKVRTASAGRVALTTLAMVGTYTRQMVVPVGLSPRYASGGSVAMGACAVAVLGILLVLSARRWHRLWFVVGWFGVTLLPYLNLVRTSTAQADRYMYLAVGAWAMALGLAAEAAVGARRKRVAVGLGVAVIAAYTVLTVWQSRVWSTSQRLWERALTVAPDDPLAHYLLGEAVLDRQPRRAARHFRRAADAHREATAAHADGAGAAYERGDPDLAQRHLRLCDEHDRLTADALAYLGTALRLAGDLEGALTAHREATRLNRSSAEFAYLVASDLAILRRTREALPYYEAAAAGPDWLGDQVRRDLRELRATLGDSPDDVRAIDDLLEWIDLPTFPYPVPDRGVPPRNGQD